MRTSFICAAAALFYIQSLTAMTLGRLDASAGDLLVDIEQLQQAVASVQEPPTKQVETVLTVGNLGVGTALPIHTVTVWDERGEVLTADGEIGERLMRALKKHQEDACQTQHSIDARRADLFLEAALTYAQLSRTIISSLLESKILSKGNVAEYEAFIQHTDATMTTLRAYKEKDQ